MRISRNATRHIHYILDQLLPPRVRDSRLCMYPLFWILFGKKAGLFMDFKDRASGMDQERLRQVYAQTAACHMNRKTDLTQECVKRIEQNISGQTVLDIACGRGYLAKRLSREYQVTAADMIVDPKAVHDYPQVTFRQAELTDLPFADQEFDTVVCTHTLEHIPDIGQAVNELRRVAKERLIVVLPRQRPYKYTFDLHVHFFPYVWSVELLLGQHGPSRESTLVGGDWLFMEKLD